MNPVAVSAQLVCPKGRGLRSFVAVRLNAVRGRIVSSIGPAGIAVLKRVAVAFEVGPQRSLVLFEREVIAYMVYANLLWRKGDTGR